MRYIRREDRFPPYLPLPRFLLELDLSKTALLAYALLLDRSALSQRSGWTDDAGQVFVIFTVDDLCRQLGRGKSQVSKALNELEAQRLILRRPQGRGKPNRIYTLIPEVRGSEHGKAEAAGAEKRTQGVRKTGRTGCGKADTSYLSKTNTTSDRREYARGGGNVFAQLLEEEERL